jgi:hypothetical protein
MSGKDTLVHIPSTLKRVHRTLSTAGGRKAITPDHLQVPYQPDVVDFVRIEVHSQADDWPG